MGIRVRKINNFWVDFTSLENRLSEIDHLGLELISLTQCSDGSYVATWRERFPYVDMIRVDFILGQV